MDTRINELLNNIKSGVNKANTISYIMEEPYDPSSRPEKYPFSCNYMIGINIGSYGNTNTTLGHGDVYVFTDKNTMELRGAKFTKCASSFIEICRTLQLCYGVRYKELRTIEFESTSYLFVF